MKKIIILKFVNKKNLFIEQGVLVIAEKLGWSIAGYSLAFEVSGGLGIIALAATMVLQQPSHQESCFISIFPCTQYSLEGL